MLTKLLIANYVKCNRSIKLNGRHLTIRKFGSVHNEGLIKMTDEVAFAIKDGRPTVALESTIITHGMPYPTNLETAMAVENIVRENGAIPATIALVDGQLKVGLELSELEKLSQPSKGRAKLKLSRRDLAFAAATGASGGTTVAATMAVADKVGIRVFATGGCGGVHRGAESSMDISADLVELSRTNVALVCSGIKSILDISRTLEYLETMGVPVITLDEQCDSEHLEHVQFPAFFTRSSGLRSPMALNCIREAARVVRVHNGLDLKHGLMLAVPIPATEAATGHLVAEAIEQALLEAKEKGVSGKNVTPFILQRVNDLTQGHSLKSNCGLVRNNARVAAQIACDLYNVQNGNCTLNSSKNVPRAREKQTEQTSQAKPVVIGGSIIDYVIRTESSHLKLDGATYDASYSLSLGGVGRNMADALGKLGHRVLFLSAVGDDDNGQLVTNCNSMIDSTGFTKSTGSTSSAFVILGHAGDCKLVACDLSAHKFVTAEHVSKFEAAIKRSPMVVMDANIPLETMNKMAAICTTNRVPIWYEPTDLSIAHKVLDIPEQYRKPLRFASPNFAELITMAKFVSYRDADKIADVEHFEDVQQVLEHCDSLGRKVLEHCFETLLITVGKHGVVRMSKTESGQVDLEHFEATVQAEVVSVSGAGDCFTAATVSGLLRGLELSAAIRLGLRAAAMSLPVPHTVPDSLRQLSIDAL